MFNLTGKVALITGATSGIGRQQALALSKAGAKIVAVGRRADRLEDTVASIQSAGGQGAALQAELNLDGSLASVARQAADFFGPIDILFNTLPAGAPLEILATWAGSPAGSLPVGAVRKQYNVN